MDKRNFLKSVCVILAGSAACLLSGGCIAPLVSPRVSNKNLQAWRCGNCGHLTRSDQDLTTTRCPRCHHKGFFTRITEEDLQNCTISNYLKKSKASR